MKVYRWKWVLACWVILAPLLHTYAQQEAPKWEIGLRTWVEAAARYQWEDGRASLVSQPRAALGGGIVMRKWFLPHVGIEMGGSYISRGYKAPYLLQDERLSSGDTLLGKRMEQWWQVPVGLCFRLGSWYAALGPFAELYQEGHWRLRTTDGVPLRIPFGQEDTPQAVTFGAWFGTGFTFHLNDQLGVLTSLRAHITDPLSPDTGIRGLPASRYSGNVNGGVNLGLLYQM